MLRFVQIGFRDGPSDDLVHPRVDEVIYLADRSDGLSICSFIPHIADL